MKEPRQLATEKAIEIPVGVVITRTPGVTRWAKWIWRASAVLPGAGPATWHLLREENDVKEFHAATLPLTLHRTETEAYREALNSDPPSLWVVLRPDEAPDAPHDVRPHLVTASAYEAQDYLDSGEEIVERVEMPAALVAWVREFIERHHVEETFKKRKRRNWHEDKAQDGIGDARIRQGFDVYRAPSQLKPRSDTH